MRETIPAILGPDVSPTVCEDGAEALWHAGRIRPVLVLLSASLPVVSAMDVAAVLTRHHEDVETVAVGVGVGEADRAGPVLAAGARHVVSRPYREVEVEPLLRTHRERAERAVAVLAVGPLELNGPAFEVRAAGRPLPLTLREFELLRLLMLHAGDVLSLERIGREIWGARGETVSANTIAVHMRHLRRHLQGIAAIVAVRGVGYRLSVLVDRAGQARSESRSAWLGRRVDAAVTGA